jgi:adenylate cyclase
MISPADILHGKILIVDDQEANVLLLEQLLRGAGYDSVSSTTNSEKVCELHLVNRYDLILLDLQMPGMDGFQVMENLKEIEKGGYLPVLVITAQPAHKLRALKAGAKDFVSKPLDLAEVLLRVHNMLEVRLLHQEATKLCERVVSEQKVSERLLLRALPPSIAELLKPRSGAAPEGSADLIAESWAEVTALFANIVEFTKFAEGASAQALIGVLDDVSRRGDRQAGDAVLDRQRITGDAYLASIGLSDAATLHTIRASHMAMDLVEAANRFNEHSRYKLLLRIGIDALGAGKRNTLIDL